MANAETLPLTDVGNHTIVWADKAELMRLLDEQNAQEGFVPDPTATHESVRAHMQALGVRAEDNGASCGIIAARDDY